MDLDDFKEFLEEYGIEYYEAGQSLCLKECPACGSSRFKVLLRVHNVDLDEDDGVFFGRCQRGSCEEGYSSIKYLLRMGVPKHEVLTLHGRDPIAALENFANPGLKPKKDELAFTGLESNNSTPKEEPEKVISISEFHKISAWPNYPASLYAIKRGVTEHFYDEILVDVDVNAVVFICRNANGDPIGYQKRFVKPTNPDMKTQTSAGWSKTKHILNYPNDGDILICEGPFTAVSAWSYGFHAVCTFGSHVSNQQIEQIIEIAEKTGKEIGVAAENDKAGLKAYKAVRSHMYWKDRKIFRVYPETGKDLNDSWQAGKTYKVETNDDWLGPSIPDVDFFGTES